MMFTKEEIIEASGAEVLFDNGNNVKYNISTDTRTIAAGDIYLPLKGESFDGEDFIQNALASGVRAYFTLKNNIFDGADLVLKVSDTKKAYMDLAKYYLNLVNPIKVGVTGSSGKTTTKEMIYSVLSHGFRTHKTYSNHNNEIGFCQTVLSMPFDTEVLIVEMGMRGLGEIKLISDYLSPNVAVVTNSGSAHVGRLGSLDNIAIAKCEIASGLVKDGFFVAKSQDIIKKHLNFEGKKCFYSLNDVHVIEKSRSCSKFEYKDGVYELNVEGDYNIENSLAAIEVGLYLGMSSHDISKGLLSYKPIEKRWEIIKLGSLNFINDSYNANPESMSAATKTFIELYDNPVVVLGNMGELGDCETDYHAKVGEYIASVAKGKNIKFITVGNLAAEIGKILKEKDFDVEIFDDNKQASCYIVENLRGDYTIFLKASRAMKFEEIIDDVRRGIVKL